MGRSYRHQSAQAAHGKKLAICCQSYPQPEAMAMMLAPIKQGLQKILHPIAKVLFDDGVRAVHVTLCAGLISVAIGVLVAAFAFHLWIFVLIPIWMLIRMAFAAVEALLVDEFGQHSKAGTCAHELSRVVGETALLLPFAVIPKVSVLLVLLVTLLAIFSEFASLLGPLINASKRRDGPMNADLRMTCFALFGAGIASGYLPTALTNIALAVIALLLLVTIFNRVRRAVYEASAPGKPSVQEIVATK